MHINCSIHAQALPRLRMLNQRLFILCTIIIYDVYIMYWVFDEHLKLCCCNSCSRSQMKKNTCTCSYCFTLRTWKAILLCFVCCMIVLCCLYMNNYWRGASRSVVDGWSPSSTVNAGGWVAANQYSWILIIQTPLATGVRIHVRMIENQYSTIWIRLISISISGVM